MLDLGSVDRDISIVVSNLGSKSEYEIVLITLKLDLMRQLKLDVGDNGNHMDGSRRIDDVLVHTNIVA